ncbi:MAG: LLM class flavin-dependent oxidoreductase [Dehalococcoidia bacterium]
MIEGLHGLPFNRAVTCMRETVEIVRLAINGERVAFDGKVYKIPYPSGLTRAMRMGNKPRHIPITWRRSDRRTSNTTASWPDGWLSAWFFPESAGTSTSPYVPRPSAPVACSRRSTSRCGWCSPSRMMPTGPSPRPRRSSPARWHGWLPRTHHFFNDAYRRQGYGDLAAATQNAWLAATKHEAAALIPDDFPPAGRIWSAPTRW